MSELEQSPPHGSTDGDVEKGTAKVPVASKESVFTTEATVEPVSRWSALLLRAASFGRVEVRGIAPVPVEERTSKRTVNVFTLWWCMNANILPITFGMLGPVFGLSLRDAALVILFFTLLTTTIPAYLATLGPKTGMRQMVQARFSWGRYMVSFPVLLNLATLTGFCVIMCVIGGQCLSAAAGGGRLTPAVGGGRLTPAVGIVITALASLVISFCGYRVLHVYERWAWVPALLAIIVAAGCGGEGLRQQGPAEPATAKGVLSFGMIIASYMIPWACLASDFTTYVDPSTPSIKIFAYSYAGLAVPTILLMTLGSAMASARPNIPSWQAGYEANLVGGVMDAMLSPAGGFGKFLVVLLSFSLLGNLAGTSYSVTLNLQLIVPWLLKVPRYLFAVVLTAIIIPVSIRAAEEFFVSLENFIALIGYWSSSFVAVLIVEHLYFRRGRCASYDVAIWDSASKLPVGVAALASFLLSFALVIPSIAQIWWTGPIAAVTGDIGFELAFVVTAVLYVPLRTLEKRFTSR